MEMTFHIGAQPMGYPEELIRAIQGEPVGTLVYHEEE
jgi:hypothetical protein